MKKAFTMLELVMVMVIMGIVASIGADIVASMYSNYLHSRAINQLESQTEITLEQIAKRLQYRIKESVITRDATGDFKALSNYDGTGNYNILEWIGYSNESFLGTPRPGWSGFIDLNSTDTNKIARTLKTSESNLSDANNTISALTQDDINLITSGKEAAIIFKGIAYNAVDFGWRTPALGNTDGKATLKVTLKSGTIDIFETNEANTTDEITEQYYLAHSAYAIVPEGNSTTDFNLTLRYNYQPWHGEDYNSTIPSVLAEHVSLFRFKQDDSILRLKLCIHDNNNTGIGDRIVICKEKVVY